MRQILAGAVLVIAGIAAFIEASSHRPEVRHGIPRFSRGQVLGYLALTGPSRGLSQTAYDLLRIGAWALVIVGGLLVITGLIRYWSSQRSPAEGQPLRTGDES
jgi:uncharacterized membrane protein HdeD (DUF308 family)